MATILGGTGITDDVTFLEMFPLLVSLQIGCGNLKNKKNVFRSDNLASVHIVSYMTSKNDIVMIILKYLTLLCLRLNVAFKSQHVGGFSNQIPDALSRFLF